jgi:hypothetical protein
VTISRGTRLGPGNIVAKLVRREAQSLSCREHIDGQHALVMGRSTSDYF